MRDKDHMYYSASTLQEIVDEIKDNHRWDIPKGGCYIEGIMTATGDLLGMLNTRHPDVVITREAVDVHQMQSTIDELRAKNKELATRNVLVEEDRISARQDLRLKNIRIHSLEKQCDDLGKELTQLKNCDYFTIEQVRELVPDYVKITDDMLPSEKIYSDGWNGCVCTMNARITMTSPAGHTLDETMQADAINKLKAEVEALENRLKQLKGELFSPLAKKEEKD